ncbi:GspE/PulE family protein [Thiohalobacter sp. IOR34]|uniref:GspE/PulE family protein n=1 Tax=Thiohalobacter sp. IOR34 TaxID=3057176 RepID=UPI0025B1AF78|nr:GspE/PulE family protein [Thiohalobacter sp. IOR34]WJW75321.1 GspE/PulE family protein [Thiohalobacter sp. IOR34]
MGRLLRLSPDSFAAEAAPRQDSGARVALELLDGSRLEGELRAFDAGQGRCVVRPADQAEDREVDFASLRWLRFAQDLAPALHDAAEPVQTFHVRYADGGMLHGVCRDALIDHDGLHLLAEQEGGAVCRLFIPLQTVLRYRIGELSGRGHAQGLRAVNEEEARQPVESAEQLALLISAGNRLDAYALAEAAGVDANETEGRSPAELARRLGVPYVRLRNFDIDPQLLSLVPEDIAREHRVLPLLLINDRLVVAMTNPADAELLSVLHFVSGHNVEGCVAAEDDLQAAIDRYYSVSQDNDALQELEGVAQRELASMIPVHVVERMGKEKPIVRLVASILREAIRRGASDIHLRPGEKHVELLYRQDGTLVPVRSFSKVLLPAVVARIKIIGRMNIAERRLPQDGRARMIEGDAVVDMRISVIPTVDGESVVIRLLNAQAGLRSIAELGFNPRDAELVTDLLHKSYGLMLVTGPTGSGKSTTLYAALQEVKKQNLNIITIEDPVEYHIDGIQQIQVNTAPGFTFARALRNILRHDPDVVMVGEIRDQETAKIAVESALTGHLVLSTLHTNDAPTTITRLLEMGVESFLVKSSLLGVLAQRLVRLNCPACIEVEPVDAAVRKFLGVPEDEVFYHGRGCDACHGTGFQGRMAVYELLIVTPAMRDIITPEVELGAIRRQAIADGMVPLTAHALQLARESRISLVEVYRVRLE